MQTFVPIETGLSQHLRLSLEVHLPQGSPQQVRRTTGDELNPLGVLSSSLSVKRVALSSLVCSFALAARQPYGLPLALAALTQGDQSRMRRTIAGAHGLHGERGAKAVGGVLMRVAQRAVGRDRRQRPAQLVLVQLRRCTEALRDICG